ncbi:aldehyde dehydrogenase [Salpingoeca rosetta]|uniref:Aldehyde dehydrogenase n=1 Tax=Salpingoeca rosetta (strain ATCC 50818 / BSB-021) TaxID=946362 RepID=F2UQ17_SALR5|nr:aldehyde dehydrogenase [Salpingoeca rosetta]EGD79685.1 aldehyde dehydrogenase [Salpingoeca rosetta]|eukprot:XP_004988635.1 aldehyde dehydrogenase [Salpingoeca rosetta]
MLMMHKIARLEYVPLGVLGAIIPWNYPFHNMYGQIISALFAGNGIVLKVSEYASWSSRYYLSIVHAALRAVGYSPDLVQVVTGFGATGAALVNGGVDKVVFIGSPGVGKLVMRAAADTLTPVVLELGGKDAAVVCEDCDFGQVVNLALRGTFQNCGQNCIGLERMIVHKDVYDKFVDALAAKVGALRQGAPLAGDVDCGAMTMGRPAAEKLEKMVEEAVRSGARLLAGGHVNTIAGCSGGFFQPTLLVDVTPDMHIAQEETFGPIMTLMRAEDDEDAIRIANSVEYGLGSSVFSKNYARAERIAAAFTTGMCNVNDYGVNYLCQSLPFGGVKISGFDRFAGVEGLRGCCHMRSITTDKFYGVRTDIPPPLQYPLTGSGFEFCRNLVNLFYSSTWLQRIGAAYNLAVIGATEKKPKTN